MEERTSELERFRQQWRAEVEARSKTDAPTAHSQAAPGLSKSAHGLHKPSKSNHINRSRPSNDYIEPLRRANATVENPTHEQDSDDDDISGFETKTGTQEPQSALEHYEKAVEKEAHGKLGDSLDLYRKAFRMDSNVDQKYKNKHFPPSHFASKPANSNPSNASPTVPNPAHHSLDGPPRPIKDLIASFANLQIEPAPAEIESTPPPPCPIITLPREILIQILREVAILDVSSFTHLALVCKPFAYLVATEEQIWKRVCLGSEVGFGAMHYAWQREINWDPLLQDAHDGADFDFRNQTASDDPSVKKPTSDPLATTTTLLHSAYASSYNRMFRLRPRIRFNGVYISTVNYIRPGQASANQITWNSPVHIVTYYRYLRFYRDGTILSLLTTSEPADVVHYLTKEFWILHSDPRNQMAHLPSSVMIGGLRGRWRLSSSDEGDGEGDVFIETEGVGGKIVGNRYIYRMELTLRSVGKGVGNNKLLWKGYWCYNRLTDDWGEFGLRNDKAFFWSRVKSYGDGE